MHSLLIFLMFVFSLISHGQQPETRIIYELFRLRNEHKADSVALFFADTVHVYMKYLRNIPRKRIAEVDRVFWKDHPKNKFEMTEPVKIKKKDGLLIAIIYGNEYLDGASFKKERIEIIFDRNKKINSFRGFSIK